MGFRNHTARKVLQNVKTSTVTTPLPVTIPETLASIPHYYFNSADDYVPSWPSTSVCFWHWSDVPGAAAAICLLFVVVPFVIAAVAYVSLYRIALKHAKQIRRESRVGGAAGIVHSGVSLGLLAAHEAEAMRERRASFNFDGGDGEIQYGAGLVDEGYVGTGDPDTDSLE
jgi:hypothetical protein